MAEIGDGAERLVKSRQRVSDHGEVFTPAWLVEDMLNLVEDESRRIESRFLEPACGSGNFLAPVLERKLAAVQARYGRSDFERRHFALLALMCVYGIELLADNAAECRARLLGIFARFVGPDIVWNKAAEHVLSLNIVRGDALTLSTADGDAITFPEWAYLGKGRFQRRDFRYDKLTERSEFGVGLFEEFEAHEIFVPARTYPPMSVQELAS